MNRRLPMNLGAKFPLIRRCEDAMAGRAPSPLPKERGAPEVCFRLMGVDSIVCRWELFSGIF
jgi:hypothetical protein